MATFLGIILGSVIFAFGLNYFTIANGLAEGGFTGIALIIHYLADWPVGIIIFLLNLPLFFIGAWKWGRSFLLKTLLGVAAVSLAIDLTSGWGLVTDNLLLAALYGGVLSGIGIGMVLRSGATTGGIDIIARLVNEHWGISMGKVFLAADTVVLAFVAAFFGLEKALYSLVTLYVFSKVVDEVLEGFSSARAVIIISPTVAAISQTVIKELDRGATILKGYGAYTGKDKDVLYVIIGQRQLPQLKKIVWENDPQAFVIVNDVHEVLGEGFRKQG